MIYSKKFKKTILNDLVKFIVDFEIDLMKNNFMHDVQKLITSIINNEDIIDILKRLPNALVVHYMNDEPVIMELNRIKDYYEHEMLIIKNIDIMNEMINIDIESILRETADMIQNYQINGNLPEDADTLIKNCNKLKRLVELHKDLILTNYG